ncbi:MAG TPA: hypothetical protein VHS80_00220, partial [Chthoniobacterales bacterium]|nr:hypothetical protein [Chthoniobacterales bacterium]
LISMRFRDLVASRLQLDTPEAAGARFACHVRLGDYNPSPETPSEANARLPMDWYIAQLRSVLQAWPGIPIDLFSDGNDGELNELLQLPDVRRADHGDPVADLLAMTQARLLICSGSTFSAWAAFLGQMPTIWYPERCASLFGEQTLPNAIHRQTAEPLSASFCERVRLH